MQENVFPRQNRENESNNERIVYSFELLSAAKRNSGKDTQSSTSWNKSIAIMPRKVLYCVSENGERLPGNAAQRLHAKIRPPPELRGASIRPLVRAAAGTLRRGLRIPRTR